MSCGSIFLVLGLGALIWLAVRPWLVSHGWRQSAEQMSLQYQPANGFLGVPRPGEMTGKYCGRKLRLEIFVERIPHSEGESRTNFIQIHLGLKRSIPQRLLVLKHWHHQLSRRGEGMLLPDRDFSARYSIAGSDPPDFALKVFQRDELRAHFDRTVGRRGSFYLNIEKRVLHFSTRAGNWFLPASGIDWRPAALQGLVDALCELAEAAENAPAAPWTFGYLREEPEALAHPELGSPKGAYAAADHGPNPRGALILGLALVLVMLAFAVMRAETPQLGLTCLALALPFVLLGIGMSRKAQERLLLFEGGLTYRKGSRIQAYTWKDLPAVWQKWDRRRMKLMVHLVDECGKKIPISRIVPQDEAFLQVIFKGSYEAQKRDLISQHRSGKPVVFGPLALEGDWLVCGEQRFRLDEVRSLPMDTHGYLSVQLGKELVPLAKVMVSQVPNLHVLNGLLTDLQGRESAMRAFEQAARKPGPAEVDRNDPRWHAIYSGLESLIHDDQKSFVIFHAAGSETFVQFLKLAKDALLFDLPLSSLNETAFGRALDFFDETILASSLNPGRDGVIQMEFGTDEQDLHQATAMAVGVFVQVFSSEGELAVSFGRS